MYTYAIYRGLAILLGMVMILISSHPDSEEIHKGRYISGILIELICIIELIIVNPNEWLLFKISVIVLITLCLSILVFPNESVLAWFIGLIITVLCTITALAFGICYKNPTRHVEQTVDIIEIVSMNDAYSIEGHGSILSFVMDEKGVYRFYYKTDSGLKRQGSIDSDMAYIDDTLSPNLTPYIEKVIGYDIVYGTYNKQTVERDINEKEWYVFHIPYGSIVESYDLNLQ